MASLSLPLPQEDISQIVVRLGVIGFDPQCLLVVFHRLWHLAQLHQGHSEIEIRAGGIGIDLQRLLILPDGLRKSAQLTEHKPQDHVRLAHLRRNFDARCA